MASTAKKRSQQYSTSPKQKTSSKSRQLSSSSSLNKPLMEPSPYIFPSKSDLFRLVAVITIASSVAVACNFFVTILNRPAKPFCDSITDYEDSISDICDPCPQNGECYQGKLECVRGYRKHGKLCVEDGDINEKAKKLTEMVETRVCEAYTRFSCYGTDTVWVREDTIWSDLDEFKLMEKLGMDNSIYLLTKWRAIEASGKVLESRTNFQGIKELKCPDILADHYKPYTCQIRQWILENVLILIPVFVLLVGCTMLLRKILRKRHLTTRAEDLYNQICDILEEHALMSKSVNSETEPWMVVSLLRDHLLLPSERKDSELWKKVEKLVQEDSRLDRYPKLVKGDSKVVWEWQVEGSLSSSRIKKKRVVSQQVKASERAAATMLG